MVWDRLIREELEGLVPYAPGLRVSQVRERSGKQEILKLSSNEHPSGPVPLALEAMTAVLTRLNRYPDGGAVALRRKIADRLDVAFEQVAVGNGSNELIRLLAQVVLRPGDEVVYAWPSFVVYPMVTNILNAAHVRVPLDSADAHDLEAMADAITDKTRIVFICNPNNPTGSIVRRAVFERFLDRVPEDVLLVIDEAYFEFVTDADFPDGLHYFDGMRPLVVARTFSKMYSLAGLRVGYAIAPEPIVRAVDTCREPFNVNTVAQVGAYYAMDDTAEVVRRRDENQEQRRLLCEAFDRLGIGWVPSETNFVYAKTERPVEVFQALLEEGVIVRDFGNAPALRVGIGTPRGTARTIEAFEAVVSRLGSV